MLARIVSWGRSTLSVASAIDIAVACYLFVTGEYAKEPMLGGVLPWPALLVGLMAGGVVIFAIAAGPALIERLIERPAQQRADRARRERDDRYEREREAAEQAKREEAERKQEARANRDRLYWAIAHAYRPEILDESNPDRENQIKLFYIAKKAVYEAFNSASPSERMDMPAPSFLSEKNPESLRQWHEYMNRKPR